MEKCGRAIMSDVLKQNLIAQVNQVEDINKIYKSLEETIETNDAEIIEIKRRSEAIRNMLGIDKTDIEAKIHQEKSKITEIKDEVYVSKIKTYEEITRENLLYLESRNLLDFEFENLFSKEDLFRIERELSSPIAREKWKRGDYLAVFIGALAGIVADLFTGGIDKQLKNWLGSIKNSDNFFGSTLQRWERESGGLPIDYMGPAYKGKFHRGLSAGHDILCVLFALWQIKNGTFKGLRQAGRNRFVWDIKTSNQYGTPFSTHQGLETFLLWFKHIATDFFDPTSLPVPGMGILVSMPNHEIRKFAMEAYKNGYNLRFLLAQALAPALVEVIVRGYIFGREYKETGEIKFPSAKKLKTTEMLLLSHALVMGVNVGKVAIQCYAEGPIALKNLNIPSIIMTLRYFIPFVVKRMKLNDPVEILKRNAKEITEGYDKILADLKKDLDNDREFNAFLHDGKQLII